MKVLKLRERLHEYGLLLLEHGDGWVVTDHGVKTPFEKEFADLEAVTAWLNTPLPNRLTDEEAEEFDKEFAAFVNQCDGCRRGLPLVDGVHRGEGYDAIGCTANRYGGE